MAEEERARRWGIKRSEAGEEPPPWLLEGVNAVLASQAAYHAHGDVALAQEALEGIPPHLLVPALSFVANSLLVMLAASWREDPGKVAQEMSAALYEHRHLHT